MLKANSPFLELRRIYISFSGRFLLEDVCLSFSRSEWILFLGANGSGKTSLLRLISGRLDNWEGELVVEGNVYTSANWNAQRAYEHGIAMAEQLPDLPEDFLAWEYLLWGISYQGSPFYLSQGKAISQLKEKLSFTSYFSFDLKASIANLSLSDRFKLCIASALLRARTIILWDEATIFLGHEEKNFLPELIGILAQKGLATLMVTHENLPWENQIHSLYVLEDKKIQAISPQQIASKLILYKPLSLAPISEEIAEVIKVRTNKGELVIRRGEVVSLVADSEIPLRIWEHFLWGRACQLKGKLYLKGNEISRKKFADRRQSIGSIVPVLGARYEEAYYSLVFPFLFDSSSFLSKGWFLDKSKTDSWIEKMLPVHLRARLNCLWRSLSGGEKQGIILSRELARKPSFLIASFPTQGLDRNTIELFWAKVHSFVKEEGGSLLILTTEEAEAKAFSHKVYYLEDLEPVEKEEGNV